MVPDYKLLFFTDNQIGGLVFAKLWMTSPPPPTPLTPLHRMVCYVRLSCGCLVSDLLAFCICLTFRSSIASVLCELEEFRIAIKGGVEGRWRFFVHQSFSKKWHVLLQHRFYVIVFVTWSLFWSALLFRSIAVTTFLLSVVFCLCLDGKPLF